MNFTNIASKDLMKRVYLMTRQTLTLTYFLTDAIHAIKIAKNKYWKKTE